MFLAPTDIGRTRKPKSGDGAGRAYIEYNMGHTAERASLGTGVAANTIVQPESGDIHA